MVACSAPSRPIRVTVSFANRLDHRCFAYLRVGGRVRLRICKARRQKAAGWTSREEGGRGAALKAEASKLRRSARAAIRNSLIGRRIAQLADSRL